MALRDAQFDNNRQFKEEYQKRVQMLCESLQKTNERLNKLSDAQKERLEGVANISQALAFTGVALAYMGAVAFARKLSVLHWQRYQ